ncbi:MAG: hypothetical protein ACT6T0_06625 [Nevskia sp.]|jgi:hypothetical protein|uniref:hypothetical protein n=1 Tax=Nevskia sp. TaxID=1929292 RepID=UPI0040368F54
MRTTIDGRSVPLLRDLLLGSLLALLPLLLAVRASHRPLASMDVGAVTRPQMMRATDTAEPTSVGQT